MLKYLVDEQQLHIDLSKSFFNSDTIGFKTFLGGKVCVRPSLDLDPVPFTKRIGRIF